jgi:hypothetical protein
MMMPAMSHVAVQPEAPITAVDSIQFSSIYFFQLFEFICAKSSSDVLLSASRKPIDHKTNKRH